MVPGVEPEVSNLSNASRLSDLFPMRVAKSSDALYIVPGARK
jgi:hypothetical protein